MAKRNMQSFSKATSSGVFFSDILSPHPLKLALEKLYLPPQLLVGFTCLPEVVLDLIEPGSPLPRPPQFSEAIELFDWHWNAKSPPSLWCPWHKTPTKLWVLSSLNLFSPYPSRMLKRLFCPAPDCTWWSNTTMGEGDLPFECPKCGCPILFLSDREPTAEELKY